MNLSACRVALFTAICLVLSVSADDFGEALQRRIDVTAASGGGCVVVPAGRHLIGQINLRSHVELHLEEGAVLEGQTGLEHYQVTELPYSEGAWRAFRGLSPWYLARRIRRGRRGGNVLISIILKQEY